MSKEAMKLALQALEKYCTPYQDGTHPADEAITALREALAEHPAQGCEYCNNALYAGIKCKNCGRVTEQAAIKQDLTPEQPAQQEPVADRENAIIRFALHQFMSNAYSHMNAAAQDKDNRHYTAGAVEKFAKDAKDAEALLSRLQFKAPQPAQRTWVGLTPEQRATIAEANNMLVDGDLFDAIEAELKEKNT